MIDTVLVELARLESKWDNNTITPREREKLIAWSGAIR